MKKPRIESQYIDDILKAISSIFNYTEGLSCEEFLNDRMRAEAVLLNIAIIGESAGKLSKNTQNKYPEIPFAAIISMRNRLIHGYFEVDFYRVWLVVKDDLPILEEQIKKIVVN